MNHKIQFYLKKTLTFIGLPALALLIIGFLTFYFFVQLNLDQFKNKLTQKISKQFEREVKIESIEAQWRITNPSITLKNVSIYNNSLEKSLDLKKIRIDISWLSLLKFEPILDEIILYEPNLDIEKLAGNEYAIGGISIKTSQNSSAANWILNQDEIIIMNGKIKWRDHTRNAPALLLDNISATYESSASLTNLNRHSFNITGSLSNFNNQIINVNGYFNGSSIETLKNTNGQISLSASKIDINAFRPWFDYPAEIISANGDIEIRGDFNKGFISQIDTELDVENFVTKTNQFKEEPLTLRKFKGQISYIVNNDITKLNISKMNVVTDNGININKGELSISINAIEREIKHIGMQLNRINLKSAHEIIRHIPYTNSLQSIFEKVSPTGQLKDLKLNWKNSNNKIADLALQAQLLNVSVKPFRDLPGIKNLTGIVNINKKGGKIKSVSKDMVIVKTDLFRQALTFSQFSGEIEWKNNLFNFKNIVIKNNDINSIVNGSYKFLDQEDSIIDLTIKIPSIDLPALKSYYPIQFGEKTLKWLDTSLLKGEAQNTLVKLKGKIKDFPFVDDNNEPDVSKGIFTIDSTIVNSFIEYGLGWPELNNFDFKVNVKNNNIQFESIKGDLLENKILKMNAIVSPTNIQEPVMSIDLILDSTVPNIINAINYSPIKKVMKGFFDEMEGEGPGQLSVKLNIPLKDEDNITFKGSYEFKNSYLINNDIGMPKINNIFGVVEFDENDLRVDNLKATLAGSPITIGLNNIGDITQVNIEGIINEQFIQSTLGLNWANMINGKATWNGEFKFKEKTSSIKIESNLEGLELGLPSPFDKKGDEVTTILFTSESINSNQQIISLEIGTYAWAKLIRENNYGSLFDVKKGVININTVQKDIPDEGVLLSAELDKFDLETFNLLFKRSNSKPLITNANINIRELDIYGYKILNSNIKYLPTNNNLSIQISSRDVIGNILWNEEDNQLKAGFEKLHLKKNNPLVENENKLIFSNPPKIDIKAKSLMVDEDLYGELSLRAFKEDKVWNIENFKITNKDHKIDGTGLWDDEGLSPNTSINFTWNIQNIEKTFVQLSYPQLIQDGKASVIGMLSWPNSPFDFDKSYLKGNFSLTATDGIILEAKPGVARLFGLLTLQNLPRRLTLDFSDIFSKGFIFDRINAGVLVNNGILKSNRFLMEGPAAEVKIKGETNIIEETQNIHVVVNPRISDSLSLLSLAGGPLAGAAAFIAQKILKDPLNKIMSDEYQIIGSWDEPEEISTSRVERFGEIIDQEILTPSSEFLNIK